MLPNFDKDALRASAVTIEDGQTLTLGPQDSMAVGLAWDASDRELSGTRGKASKRLGCDLDAGATLLQGGQPVQMAWMGSLDPCKNRSVLHTGDNTTGAGDGDDETVEIQKFGDIGAEYDSLVFFVANYKKPKALTKFVTGGDDPGFHGAENVKMTLYTHDAATGEQQAFVIRPSLLDDSNVCLIARADRITKGNTGSDWSVRRISKMTTITKGDKKALLKAAIKA
jgi:tellurium resistance protein TerZ